MRRKVVITGANGLLGWHMQVFLSTIEEVEVIALDRSRFSDRTELMNAVRDADLVFHFAGNNRGTDDEIANGNPSLAERLVNALNDASSSATIAYSSSIHEDADTIYGKSKHNAGEILAAWSKKNGSSFIKFLLPHIFGEGGRPNYNSVISTFCHKVANNETPQIDNDGTIEPIHAQRLCDKMVAACDAIPSGQTTLKIDGQKMQVSEMLATLNELASSYHAGIIPDLRDDFKLDLFNTYRSYLYPQRYPIELTKHTDNRGSLVEAVKEKNGGQMFFSTTKPGITRGNHFHRHKVERFLVVSGKADIAIRKIGSDKAEVFSVDGNTPAYIDIPTLHTHNITNTGDQELLTLFWVHEIFDPENTDTYQIDV